MVKKIIPNRNFFLELLTNVYALEGKTKFLSPCTVIFTHEKSDVIPKKSRAVIADALR